MLDRAKWNKTISELRERIRYEAVVLMTRKEQIQKEKEKIASQKAKLETLKKNGTP